ncbi:MAG: HYExAFE family protein [Vulcanimicrobiota bacterium]
MTRRKGQGSHYELMFEDLLRSRKIPYLAVDESRRPVTVDGKIKNFDFIVNSSKGGYLVDIKGKLFPQESRDKKSRLYWENWVSYSDLKGLVKWKEMFGRDFLAILIFAYKILYDENIFQFWDIYNYQGFTYGLIGCLLEDYCRMARIRSVKWGAYSVKKQKFKRIMKPLRIFLPEIIN